MLTRRYRHESIFRDLGIRVTGGRRLSNGDLAAFITDIDRRAVCASGNNDETLSEIQIGDQVLEWNGVLLRGKTYEEVERVINVSQGEIEIVLKSWKEARRCSGKRCTGDRGCGERNDEAELECAEQANIAYHNSHDHHQPPPVPAHASMKSKPRPFDYRQLDDRHGCGHIQIAIGYDHLKGLLQVRILRARDLKCRVYPPNQSLLIPPNPLVKINLLPGRNISNRRRTRQLFSTQEPEWNQSVDFLIGVEELASHTLELTVWDYDKYNGEQQLGGITISLGDPSISYNVSRWYSLQRPSPSRTSHYNAVANDDTERFMSEGDWQHHKYQARFDNMTNGYPAIA